MVGTSRPKNLYEAMSDSCHCTRLSYFGNMTTGTRRSKTYLKGTLTREMLAH